MGILCLVVLCTPFWITSNVNRTNALFHCRGISCTPRISCMPRTQPPAKVMGSPGNKEYSPVQQPHWEANCNAWVTRYGCLWCSNAVATNHLEPFSRKMSSGIFAIKPTNVRKLAIILSILTLALFVSFRSTDKLHWYSTPTFMICQFRECAMESTCFKYFSYCGFHGTGGTQTIAAMRLVKP